jgi:hypothetical protein
MCQPTMVVGLLSRAKRMRQVRARSDHGLTAFVTTEAYPKWHAAISVLDSCVSCICLTVGRGFVARAQTIHLRHWDC